MKEIAREILWLLMFWVIGAVILTCILYFAVKPAHSAESILPMSARIINLTNVPLEEAIAFCDARNLICPALRSQWDEITKVQFDADELNSLEPAAGNTEEVYE